jgi:hypothetical protein
MFRHPAVVTAEVAVLGDEQLELAYRWALRLREGRRELLAKGPHVRVVEIA